MVESRARGGEGGKGGGGGAGPDADRQGVAQEEPERSIWVKLADADVSEDWETAEVLTVLHWLRQIVGIVTGIVLGVAGVTGSAGNIGFLVSSSLIVFAFYSGYMRVDEDYHGGHVKLLMEGLAPSYALMLLMWIIIYSLRVM